MVKNVLIDLPRYGLNSSNLFPAQVALNMDNTDQNGE